MNIEIRSVDKNCERNCPHCTMARKGRDISYQEINDDVQKTFSFLENVIKNNKIKYCLVHGIPSAPMLKITSQKFLKRITFHSNESELSSIRVFSNNIRLKLKNSFLKPDRISVLINPKTAPISETDAVLLKNLTKELSAWFFKSRNRSLGMMFDSDIFIDDSLDENIKQILSADKKLLFPLARENSINGLGVSEQKIPPLGKNYCTSYLAKSGSNEISFTHRVIFQPSQKLHTNVDNLVSAESFYPKEANHVNLMITSRGVMLMHSTLNINNPIFWVNHNDFTESLSDFAKINKGKLLMLNFMQKMLLENRSMYLKSSVMELKLKNEEFKEYFRTNRRNID